MHKIITRNCAAAFFLLAPISSPVGNVLELAQDGGQRDAGEDVGVVALAGFEPLSPEFDGIERTSGTEDAASLRVLVGFGGRALGARGRVGEGENDGPLVRRRHVLQDAGSESPADRRRPDYHAEV